MQLPNIENLTLLLTFVVPGFVAYQGIKLFSVPNHGGGSDYLTAYVTLSALNFLVFGLLIPVANNSGFHVSVRFAAWGAYVFLGPFVIGIAIGTMIQRNFLFWMAEKAPFTWLKVRPLSHIPTAWDWKFGQTEQEFVLVVLKDGTEFSGLLGPDSFISTDPAERDIYIQKLFELDENGDWLATEKSLYVGKNEIRTMEFWPAGTNG